ncbi:MAG: hypothetical protein GY796_05680, partial [Chloroflexi bacterium]|nr:hypothetical protein [Chloroflexota bacterium]
KQALAHHYQLDPALPDAEFLPRLTPYFQPEEIDRLAVLLSRADSVGRCEEELIRWSEEMLQWPSS